MKRDAAAIRAFIEGLPLKPWIAGTSRARWPLNLFRIDDVRATASILENGFLYSRNRAAAKHVLGHDAASREVIENSPRWIKDYVRLYFRPRTPTEFHSEGFRPPSEQVLSSNRPMPIVLVFEAVPIMTADGCEFTNGNAASSSVERGDSIDFLKAIPFEKVYHEGPLADSVKRDIVFRRCAEVLVRDQLDLKNLKHVLCRSQAEYETLLNIMSDSARKRFRSLIGVSAKVHCRQWSFLESVDLSDERITFRFSPSSRTPGPFHAVGKIFNPAGKLIGQWSDKQFQAIGPRAVGLAKVGKPAAYRVTLELDGALAYSGVLKDRDSLL